MYVGKPAMTPTLRTVGKLHEVLTPVGDVKNVKIRPT
jgi:hypothetical protein